MDILILATQEGDWEGIYIDGSLYEEGHTLGEGNNFFYLLEKAEQFGFKRKDVREAVLNDEDNEITKDYGNMASKLKDFTGTY